MVSFPVLAQAYVASQVAMHTRPALSVDDDKIHYFIITVCICLVFHARSNSDSHHRRMYSIAYADKSLS